MYYLVIVRIILKNNNSNNNLARVIEVIVIVIAFRIKHLINIMNCFKRRKKNCFDYIKITNI